MTQTPNPADEVAACCATFYEQDIVQQLMGASFHPGGADLSKKLIESLSLPPKSKTLDVACGVGTTTGIMAKHFGFDATGIDFSKLNIEKAKQKTSAPIVTTNPNQVDAAKTPCCGPGETCEEEPQLIGLTSQTIANINANANVVPGSLDFLQGTADDLPFGDDTFEGLTCECAVSTFVKQQAVAAEFCRVLKPGGVFGMTDMALTGPLPTEFSQKAASWTCVENAKTIEQYRSLFEANQMELIDSQDHSDCLLDLATEMKRKLVMSGFGVALGALPSLKMDVSEMRALLKQATELVSTGTIQYVRLVFRKH